MSTTHTYNRQKREEGGRKKAQEKECEAE